MRFSSLALCIGRTACSKFFHEVRFIIAGSLFIDVDYRYKGGAMSRSAYYAISYTHVITHIIFHVALLYSSH